MPKDLSLRYDLDGYTGGIELRMIGDAPALSVENDPGDFAIISVERHEAVAIRDWLNDYLKETET